MEDLQVQRHSEALLGRHLDVVISGSIGAVESVRFIRSLRRLGADVTPWLTRGGSRFVTETALSWAAARPAITNFQGDAPHIATGDAVIVAPASASFLARLARGMTNSPETALATSALGQNKPVVVLPNMHDSLMQAPGVRENLAKLSEWGVINAPLREEEGKRKFPDPATLADFTANVVNKPKYSNKPVLVTMGTTRGYIDAVRYVSNESSGRLGTSIVQELYRSGFPTTVVCGPCPHKPALANKRIDVRTTREMLDACLSTAQSAGPGGLFGGVFTAAVLDYEPQQLESAKIRSGQEQLNIELKPTPKVIGAVADKIRHKVGFKLDTDLTPQKAEDWANQYCEKYGLSMVIVNDQANVGAVEHRADIFVAPIKGTASAPKKIAGVDSKLAITRHIVEHFTNVSQR